MATDTISRIERWFDGENEEGDFIRVRRDDPLLVYGPSEECHKIIYCTKLTLASAAIDNDLAGFNATLVTRFGLPREEDASWLQSLCGDRQLLFVGDLDPVDLMIFAWLRLRLPSIKVTHHGINDRLIAALGATVPKTYRIELGSIEVAAVAELKELVPDIEGLLGPGCCRILADGYKLELEAIWSTVRSARPLFGADN